MFFCFLHFPILYMQILKSIYLKDVEKEDLVFFYCQALTEKQEESTDIKVIRYTSHY